MSFNDDFDVDEDEKDRLVHLNRSRPKPARSVKLRVKDPVKISNVAIKEDDEDEEASDEEVIHKGNTKDDILKKVQKAGGVAMPFTANLSDLKKNKRFTCYANLSANNELTKIEMSKPEVSNFTAKQKIEDDKHIENIVRLRRVNQSDNKENSVKQSEQENSKKPPIQIKLKTPTEEKKSEILDFLAHKPLDEPNRLIPVKELARIFNNGKTSNNGIKKTATEKLDNSEESSTKKNFFKYMTNGKSSDELDQIKNEERNQIKCVPLRSKSFRHPVNKSNKTELPKIQNDDEEEVSKKNSIKEKDDQKKAYLKIVSEIKKEIIILDEPFKRPILRPVNKKEENIEEDLKKIESIELKRDDWRTKSFKQRVNIFNKAPNNQNEIEKIGLKNDKAALKVQNKNVENVNILKQETNNNLTKKCSNCNALNKLIGNFCDQCGSIFKKSCPRCSIECNNSNNFCIICGFDFTKSTINDDLVRF